MAEVARSSRLWTRRRIASAGLVALGAALGLPGARHATSVAIADESQLLIVSRKRLLNDTRHAKLLLKAEIDLTAELQAKVDAIKEALSAEEQELARLRPTLDRALFESRVTAFDRRVRTERRESQEMAAALQNAFRAERVKLVEAIDPLLQALREAHGATVILNSDQLMAWDPALDATDEAIERFNEIVPPPNIPTLESLAANPPVAPAPSSGGAGTSQ